jgi:hypothetical protein
MVRWLQANWAVIVVAVIISVLADQLISQWRDARLRTRDERRHREDVFRRLLGPLRAHCESLMPKLLEPAVDPERWKHINADLLARAQETEVRSALALSYDAYLAAIAAETRAIENQRRIQRDATAKARTIENVADVLIAYAPFVRRFGDPRAAREFEAVARRSYDYAQTLRSAGPTG